MPSERSAAALTILALVGACFGEAPGASGTSEDASSSETTGTAATTTSAVDTTSESTATTTGDDPSGTDADSSSAGTETAEVTTGDVLPCECPDDAALCEGFEDAFDLQTPPWALPGGGAAPTVIGDPVQCGRAALSTAVSTGDPYSAATVRLPGDLGDPGLHRVGVWLRLQAKCLTEPTRILQVQESGPGGATFVYGLDLFATGDMLELQLSNAMGANVPHSSPFALADGQWYSVAIEFDVSVAPPVASVFVDGIAVIQGAVGPMNTPPDGPEFAATLGVFRPVDFTDACTVVYDEFSAG